MLQTVMQLSWASRTPRTRSPSSPRGTPRPGSVRCGRRPAGASFSQLRLVAADPGAEAAEGEGDAGHAREADLPARGQRLVDAGGRDGCAARSTSISASRATKRSRSSVSRIDSIGAPSTRTPYLLEHPAAVQLDPAVERGLAAEAEQDAVRLLRLDHLLDELGRHRHEVDLVGQVLRGLDGGDVGVDQDGADPLLLERLDRLAARVVELAGLADLERRAAEHQHRCAAGRSSSTPPVHQRRRSRRRSRPCPPGPGLASGWNWTPQNGLDAWRMPSTVPSLALTNHSRQSVGQRSRRAPRSRGSAR